MISLSVFGSPHFYFVMGLVIIIIIFQFATFSKNLKRIDNLRSIFSSMPGLQMVKIYIPEDQYTILETSEIIRKMNCFKDPSVDQSQDEVDINKHVELRRRGKRIWVKENQVNDYKKAGWAEGNQNFKGNWFEITLIDKTYGNHPVLSEILLSLNTYLLRNKGSVSDFHLVKDIVDRHCDAADEEINNTLAFPLYLGLMGTILGIVFSVGYLVLTDAFQNFLAPNPNTPIDNTVITILMGGVGLAMISSFTGLGFTMLNSVKNYKDAKTHLEKEKNSFFTLIQTELLPILSQNAASNLHRLESNLQNFNENFAHNNDNFSNTLQQIHQSLEGHAEMIKELKDIDLKTITRFNRDVLRELKESIKEFQTFNDYFGQVNVYIGLVNTLVESADKLNLKLNLQLDRTKTIEEVAIKLNENTLINKKIIDFMAAHFEELKERTMLFSMVISDVDENLSKTLDQLGSSLRNNTEKFYEQLQQLMDEQNKNTFLLVNDLHQHTSESVQKVKNIQLEQVEAVNENKNLFEKLNHLEQIPKGFEALAKSIEKQETVLKEINSNLPRGFQNGVKELEEPTPESFWQKIERGVKYAFYTSGAIIGSSFIIWQLFRLIRSIF